MGLISAPWFHWLQSLFLRCARTLELRVRSDFGLSQSIRLPRGQPTEALVLTDDYFKSWLPPQVGDLRYFRRPETAKYLTSFHFHLTDLAVAAFGGDFHYPTMGNSRDRPTREMWEKNKEAIRKLCLERNSPDGRKLTHKEVLERIEGLGIFATSVTPQTQTSRSYC